MNNVYRITYLFTIFMHMNNIYETQQDTCVMRINEYFSREGK